MPSRVALTLEPLTPAAGTRSGNDGPALQAAFLDIITRSDAALADLLHQPGQQVRPYSLTTTRPSGGLVVMELGFLDDAIVPSVVDALDQIDELTTLNSSRRYRLLRGDIYSLSYHDLSDTPGDPNWTIELVSPYMRRRPGRNGQPERVDVLPNPNPLLDRLAQRHNLYSPSPLPTPTEEWIDRVVISRIHHLETTVHLVETAKRRICYRGATGTIDLQLLRPTDDEARSLSILLQLANYTGIGDRTTIGMGHTRCTPTRQHNRRPATDQAQGRARHRR
jgi:CRISPR-associated endoribonuclease Cas6